MMKKPPLDEVKPLIDELKWSDVRLTWKRLVNDLKALKKMNSPDHLSLCEKELRSVESAIIKSEQADQPKPDSQLMH